MRTRNEVLVGHVGVDSGSIVIGDPCYLTSDTGKTPAESSPPVPGWADVVDALFPDGSEAEGENGTSAVRVNGTFITSTPHGDGQYPVYAEVDGSGQIVSLRIDLDMDEYDEEENEEWEDD